MRYDRILRALDIARVKYENAIRVILANASKQDVSVDNSIRRLVKDPRGRAAKKAAWTPARRRKQSLLMKKRRAEEKKSNG